MKNANQLYPHLTDPVPVPMRVTIVTRISKRLFSLVEVRVKKGQSLCHRVASAKVY